MVRFYSETEVVARVSGLTVSRLRSFTAAECVMPARRGGERAYSEADLARLRLLEELGADFELDEEAAALVLGLVDQIHGLRRELRALALAVAEEPEEIRARIRDRLGDAPQDH